MKVILSENISLLGNIGDIVDVAPGYARNYLIPQKKAKDACTRNIKQFDHNKRMMESKRLKDLSNAENLARAIEAADICISKRSGEAGRLFGAVTTMEITRALLDKGIEVDRKKIILDDPIKQVGEYKIEVKIYPEVPAFINLKVESVEEETTAEQDV